MKYCLFSAGAIVLLIAGCGAGQNVETRQRASQAGQSGSRALSQTVAADQIETTVFPGKFANYQVIKVSQGYQVVDKVGSGGAKIVQSAKRLQFSDYSVSLDQAGTAAQLYRLYQAAFDRAPDLNGLGFHISAIDGSGVTFAQVAKGFIDSAEFQQKYGNTDNTSFVTLLYNNVLHRTPDAAGVAYWKGLLDAGSISREQTLLGFSESSENVAAVAPRIENGVVYQPYPIAGVGAAREHLGGTVPWGATRHMGVLLRDSRGIEVPTGHLTCISPGEQDLSIARDCSTALGRTLGSYRVSVSGDGVSATLTLKVVPPKKPFETSGTSSNAGDFSTVVTNAGNVLAWGSNGEGVLGQGVGMSKLDHSSLPLFVKDGTGSGILTNIVATSTGSSNILALSEDGTVSMWGRGSNLPTSIPNPSGTGDLSHIVQVSNGGAGNAAALTDAGKVLSWGHYNGQGTAATKRFPDYVLNPDGRDPLSGIVAVSSGYTYTLALGSNGKVYKWGDKAYLPQVVKREPDGAELSDIVAIAAGWHFNLALTSDGHVYAWGDNAWGQLGQGVEYGDYPRAMLVKGVEGQGFLSDIVMISAGYAHALALDSNGRVFSWGNGTGGPLGEGANGTRKSPFTPGYVVGPDSTGRLRDIVAISAGKSHSMALSSDGTVYLFGSGYAGALGQGGDSTVDRHFPVPLKDVSGIAPLNLSPLAAYGPLQRGSH